MFTINRLPSSVLENISPYERLDKIPPHYTLLKLFSFACFVLLQPHEFKKLEPPARVSFFLGYGIEQKGYRCWNPVPNRIGISRHVIFWKHIKFSSLSRFEVISSSEVAFFSNPSVELFQSDLNAGSSSGLVDENNTTSSSHDQSPLNSSILYMNVDPKVHSSSLFPNKLHLSFQKEHKILIVISVIINVIVSCLIYMSLVHTKKHLVILVGSKLTL